MSDSFRRDPAPAHLSDVVSPQWLTDALDGVDEGQRVVEAHIVDDYTTKLSKVRFEAVIESSDGRRETRPYCVKGDFAESVTKNLMIEGRFLRELGPGLGLRIPSCVYAGTDETTGRSLFIMNDLVSEGATFLNSQYPYTLELTNATLEQLALLHAGTWGEANLADFDWLAANRPSMADTTPAEIIHSRINDGRGDGLPDYLRDGRRIKAAMQRVTAPARGCVVHGDPHSLNIYLDRNGRPGLLDWQLAHVGHWSTDVAYHLATVLDIDSRRQHEESLLRGYLDKLAELGPEPPNWDEAWDQYCRGAAYGYFLWCLARATPRLDIVEHIPRLAAAVDDHHTFDRLGVRGI